MINKSQVKKAESEILSECLEHINHRPGEYYTILNPVSNARLNFILSQYEYNSLDELLDTMIPDLFCEAVVNKLSEQIMARKVQQAQEEISRPDKNANLENCAQSFINILNNILDKNGGQPNE